MDHQYNLIPYNVESPNFVVDPMSSSIMTSSRIFDCPPYRHWLLHFQQTLTLRNIRVLPIILPLHIILLDQPINIPLDIRYTQDAPTDRSLDDLADELRMTDGLPALHDAHDRRLRLEVAVFRHTHVRFFVFFFGFFELYLVDLDAVFGVGEVRVEGEGVGGRDVFAFGVFGEWSQFGAGERLESALYFVFGCGDLLALRRFQGLFGIVALT